MGTAESAEGAEEEKIHHRDRREHRGEEGVVVLVGLSFDPSTSSGEPGSGRTGEGVAVEGKRMDSCPVSGYGVTFLRRNDGVGERGFTAESAEGAEEEKIHHRDRREHRGEEECSGC